MQRLFRVQKYGMRMKISWVTRNNCGTALLCSDSLTLLRAVANGTNGTGSAAIHSISLHSRSTANITSEYKPECRGISDCLEMCL